MVTVCVLLSTYNGATFLSEQMESLYAQTQSDVLIYARDDGSQDETASLLASYATTHRLQWVHGENLGVKRSFAHLLKTAPKAEYYAYCDQDDVWVAEKLERAVAHLSQHPPDTPLVYFSQVVPVDHHLRHNGSPFPWVRSPITFGNALVQNVMVGCTIVMNAVARNLLLQVTPNWEAVNMHDWWANLVGSAFGRILYDPYPTVLYRQHGNNQIGMEQLHLKNRLRRFVQNNRKISTQIKEFQRCYGDIIPAEQGELLHQILSIEGSLAARLNLALSDKVYRQKRRDNAILKMLLLLNRI